LAAAALASRSGGRWIEAAGHLTQLRTVAAENQLTFPPESETEIAALESWVAQCHKEELEQQRFERGMKELRQMLVQSEEQQLSGNLPNRVELRERLESLRHKWRELELADRPVDEELQVRVTKMLRLFEVRLARLEARKRALVLGTATVLVLGAIFVSVIY